MSDSKFVGNATPFWLVGKIVTATRRDDKRETIVDFSIDVGHGNLARMAICLQSLNTGKQKEGQSRLSGLCAAGGLSTVTDTEQLCGLLLECAVIRINGSIGIEPQLLCVDFRKL